MTYTPPHIDLSNTENAFKHVSDAALRRSYRLFRLFSHRTLSNTGIMLTQLGFSMHLPIDRIVKELVFYQFCGGETLEECMHTIDALGGRKVAAVMDYGIEAKDSEEEYDHTLLQLMRLADFSTKHDNVSTITVKVTGLGSTDLLNKKHEGKDLSKEEEAAWDRFIDRLERLCRAVNENGISLWIDAEETWLQKPIDAFAYRMMEQYNRDRVVIYNTYQMYRNDKLLDLKEQIRIAKEKGYLLGAKLVRGAYMEKERDRAYKHHYPSPIYPDKTATDDGYNRAVEACLENIDHVAVCVATHNENSCLLAMSKMAELRMLPDHPHVSFAQLYGMGEFLTFNIAEAGYNSSKLIPYGPVRDVVPYLSRRAEENSSSFGQMTRELQMLSTEMRRRGLL